MPMYEYECPVCENVLEVQQKMSDDPLKTCSVCGGEVKKLVSRSTFHLKGGGWYSDGYSSAENGRKNADSKKSGCSPNKGGAGGRPSAKEERCKQCPSVA